MENYLVFRLYGPMASWGEIAIGEVRRSASYPSRSAILGLVSAALGIKRSNSEKLALLFDGYDVAVRVDSTGVLLRDYHTVQVPDSTGKYQYATRRDELIMGKDRLGTMLTSREYRCDALCIVALRERNKPPYSLVVINDKLLKPEFVLYLGRKSCPLALPILPQCINAGGFREALDSAKFPPIIARSNDEDATGRYLPLLPATRYYWENEAGDMKPQMSHERYDDPLNRTRWQFGPRTENMMTAGGES